MHIKWNKKEQSRTNIEASQRIYVFAVVFPVSFSIFI